MIPRDQVLKVWGDFACFSRPEMKVERMSYPVITPSAARGIFDAIYVKPKEFRWQVTRIELLSEPRFIALRRNEVKGRVPSERTVGQWMDGKAEPQPLLADGNDEGTGRTQRQTMALKDVCYRLHAEIRPWPDFADRQQGLEAQFRRRAANGKCVYQPCFGCREFPAYFELVEPESELSHPVNITQDLGFMLYDVFDLSRPGSAEDAPRISLFSAQLAQGVLEVPPYDSPAVRKA